LLDQLGASSGDGPASAPRTLIQSLDGLAKANTELISILFDPRISLPILGGIDGTTTANDIRRFFHEDRNQLLKAVRAINTTINGSSGSSLASLRCRCATCNPKFDDAKPNVTDWAFEVSFLPTTAQQMSQVQFVSDEGGPEKSERPLVYLTDPHQHLGQLPTVGMPTRLSLAFRLSTLVLQIASAPLGEDQGQVAEWAVAVRRTSKGVFLDPYVVLKQVSNDSVSAALSPSTGRGWRSVSREPLMTKLGLTLVEIVLGCSLADIRSEQPGLLRKDETEGYDPALVDIFTVRRLLVLGRLEQTVSARFQDVVSALITQQYRDSHDGTVRNICSQDASFMEHVAAAVLQPLYQEARRSLGYVAPPPPPRKPCTVPLTMNEQIFRYQGDTHQEKPGNFWTRRTPPRQGNAGKERQIASNQEASPQRTPSTPSQAAVSLC